LNRHWFSTVAIAMLLATALGLVECGNSTDDPSATCQITAAVTPASSTADHAQAAPANQAQFSAQASVSGNCPLIPDRLGAWTTSDPAAVTLTRDSQNPMHALATCVNATATPATISYSGTARGRQFTSATLACR